MRNGGTCEDIVCSDGQVLMGSICEDCPHGQVPSDDGTECVGVHCSSCRGAPVVSQIPVSRSVIAASILSGVVLSVWSSRRKGCAVAPNMFLSCMVKFIASATSCG